MGFELQPGHLGEGRAARPGPASSAWSLGSVRGPRLPRDRSPARWLESWSETAVWQQPRASRVLSFPSRAPDPFNSSLGLLRAHPLSWTLRPRPQLTPEAPCQGTGTPCPGSQGRSCFSADHLLGVVAGGSVPSGHCLPFSLPRSWSLRPMSQTGLPGGALGPRTQDSRNCSG